MPQIIYRMLAIGEKAVAIRSAVLGCWRSALLDAASAGILCSCLNGSEAPGRRALKLCGFLFVAISYPGRPRNQGLEFVAWERISWRAAVRCVLLGISTAAGSILVSKFSHRPIGVRLDWNKVVRFVLPGPAREEIIVVDTCSHCCFI